MKLESISGNEMLSKCRYCNGTNGSYILNKYSSIEFNIFENWHELSLQWGYTKLPERLVALTAFAANRTCSKRLVIDILERLRYPDLQCAALVGINDINVFINLIEEWNKKPEKNMSILWSIIEIWNWKLANSNEVNSPAEKWVENGVSDCIINLYNAIQNSGHAKAFIRWLFSNEYRGWKEVGTSTEKQLFFLMEAIVILDWKEELYDEDFQNMDYLSFIAIDIDKKHPLSDGLCSKILKCYFNILDEQKISCIKLPMSKNPFVWFEGFAEMFIRSKRATIKEEVQNVLNKYQSIFEGWMKHDSRNVQSETFVLCSLLLMCKYNNHNLTETSKIFCTISDHLFLQIHNCPNIYLECYSVPAYIARYTAETISVNLLAMFDEKLILRHQNMEQVAKIMEYSNEIKIQKTNRDLYRRRWEAEENAWVRKLHAPRHKEILNLLQNIMQKIST